MSLEVKNPNNLPTLSIKELIPTQVNLKDLTSTNFQKLKKSLEKHGFIFPISVWQNEDKYYLIDGHQRQRVILEEYGDVKVPVIQIPAKNINEAADILLKVTSQYGTITQEGLDEFISTYNLNEAEVYAATNYDALVSYESDEEEVLEDNPYSGKIEVPIYELKGEKPDLGELLDDSKAIALIEEIEKTNIDKTIKEFLKLGAYRHVVFDYAKIAEFYAEASVEVQELMEKSALVIIDYEKALENGFIKLSEKIARQFVNDAE